jgi:hypothetical protein
MPQKLGLVQLSRIVRSLAQDPWDHEGLRALADSQALRAQVLAAQVAAGGQARAIPPGSMGASAVIRLGEFVRLPAEVAQRGLVELVELYFAVLCFDRSYLPL